MSKYDEMSDSKIAMCVAMKIEDVTYNDLGEPDFAKDCFSETKGTHARVCWVGCDGEYVSFDPCNNPSEAWPIILDNGISINKWDKSDSFWTADVEHPKACDEYNTIEVKHENPLRAAAICFLLMKDAENE